MPGIVLQAGVKAPSITKVPTAKQLVMWAGASGDFHPIHYDQEFARAEGLPGTVVHGLLKYQFLVQMLSDWMAGGGVRKVSARYLRMDFPGDELTCRGVVTAVTVKDGLQIADCDIWIENQRGERTTTGTATVWLPEDQSAESAG